MAKDGGSRLRSWRKHKRMRQEEVAVLVGVNRVSITQYERGLSIPRPKTIARLRTLARIPASAWKMGAPVLRRRRAATAGLERLLEILQVISIAVLVAAEHRVLLRAGDAAIELYAIVARGAPAVEIMRATKNLIAMFPETGDVA